MCRPLQRIEVHANRFAVLAVQQDAGFIGAARLLNWLAMRSDCAAILPNRLLHHLRLLVALNA